MSEIDRHIYRMGYQSSGPRREFAAGNESPMPRMTMEEFLQRRAAFDEKYPPSGETLPPMPIMTPPKYDRRTGTLGPSFYIFPETAGRKLLTVIDLPNTSAVSARYLVAV